ncbi:MAG: ATP-binding protein [Campylobacterales bacterium]
MQYIIDFLEKPNIEDTEVYKHLKAQKDEALILRHMLKEYLSANEDCSVFDILNSVFDSKNYSYLNKLTLIKNLMELGWISQNSFLHLKVNEISSLELLNTSVSLSPTLLRLLEEGNVDVVLPEVKPYSDHLEYLQDQFLRIELHRKISTLKSSYTQNSPFVSRVRSELKLVEKRISERLNITKDKPDILHFFKENTLQECEQTVFLALLKEEYSGSDDSLREMNALIDLISSDEIDRIKNRGFLDEHSKLIEKGLIDYDEILTPFGGIVRNFFIPEEILQKIVHPQKKKKKQRIRLDTLVKEQDIFEFITPKKDLDSVILHPKTRERLDALLKQLDSSVLNRLKEWGIIDKKRDLNARIILYGPPGTGKTLTAISLAKSMKKQVLSFDCSNILSMYVGESEKNVRKIFDTYKDIAKKIKNEPVLLLNEADQFLSSRTVNTSGSADKMHNQMQNIFLEQIEKFEGVLIATTNLLETIDPAFSRRFNYKIEFTKPNKAQRELLWEKFLPKNAMYAEDFDMSKLADFTLTGGQIELIVKNCALRVASKDNPLFVEDDFIEEIQREQNSTFDSEKMMGFL